MSEGPRVGFEGGRGSVLVATHFADSLPAHAKLHTERCKEGRWSLSADLVASVAVEETARFSNQGKNETR